jgi:exosortase A-associated hydrolase 2
MLQPEAFFLPAPGSPAGQRLCVHHRPTGAATRSAVVYVHPFAEEMNKSRRMAALQARALAAAGHAVLQIDLLGCGDSSGNFADASWDSWTDDVVKGARWMQARTPDAPLWLWGLRGGCLLAAEAAGRLGDPVDLLLWAPVSSGRQVLQQFLRMKSMAKRLAGQGEKGRATPRDELAAGNSVEVGGYELSPALAEGLERARLTPPPTCRRLEWIEVSTRPEAGLAPASQSVLEAWRGASVAVSSQVVAGPAFWQTTEIEVAPALIETTVDCLARELTCA